MDFLYPATMPVSLAEGSSWGVWVKPGDPLVEVFQTGGGFCMYSISCQHMVLFINQGPVLPELVPGSGSVALQLHYRFETIIHSHFRYEFESSGGFPDWWRFFICTV